MQRKLLWVVALIVGVVALPNLARVSAAGTTNIRLATLAPAGSSWDKVFRAWGNSLKEQTGGAVQIQIFAGGIVGDEKDAIRKMRNKQMDASGLTSIGLGQIARPVTILQLPGIFENYAQLNKVRDKMAGEFEGMFLKENFRLLGWGDAGLGRVFSKRAILRPADYKSVRPWVAKDDPTLPVLLKMIGANGVALGIPEVFPALQTGMVDTVLASAIAAVALQWFRYVTHMSKDTSIAIVGATLVREDLFKTLAPDHQKILVETGKKAHALLIQQVQKEDQAAYKTLLSRGMIEFDPLGTPELKAEWTKINNELIEKLTGQIFPKDLLDRVRAAAAASK
jgi:TRAP-type C4-dicarboxylate transport system substrate-binding protein